MNESIPIEKRIGMLLLEKGLTMGTAESCTGGHIAAMLTSIPGSSAYFSGGVVSYSNEVKHHLLGVTEDSLNSFGAVSREVVEQMALGAIRALGCDCAVATSGIAGPTGGSPDKPVGTVWIAAAIHNRLVSQLFHFTGDRRGNIAQSAEAALVMLESLLVDIPSK